MLTDDRNRSGLRLGGISTSCLHALSGAEVKQKAASRRLFTAE